MRSDIFKTPWPYLALLAAHVIWGANYVVAKITLQEIPAMSLGFLRFGFAALLILPFILTLAPKERRIKFEHLPKLVLAGIFLAAVNITFFYLGLQRTYAIDASALDLSIPLFSVLIGWLVLKEKIFVVNLMGIGLGLAGAITIIGLPLILFGIVSPTNLFGDLLILLSAVSSVVGMTIIKKLSKNYSPVVITGFVFTVGAVAFLIPAIFEFINNPDWLGRVSILGLLGLIYIILLGSISAYFLLIYGLSKLELSHANLFQFLEPAVAATFAVPLLGERISFSFIIGTCLVVLGVYWGTLGREHHHHLIHKVHRH